MKNILNLLFIFAILSSESFSQDIFLSPENNTTYSRYGKVNLSWDSKGNPVDLYYSIDNLNWIVIGMSITDNSFEFDIPQNAINKVYFKIEYTEYVNASLIWEKIDAHSDQIRTALISPDGKYIYSGARNNSLKKWNIETELLEWESISDDPDDFVHDLDINHDGDTIIIARNNHLEIRNSDGNLLYTLDNSNFQGHCESVEWDPKGAFFAYGTDSGTLNLYRIQNNNYNLVKNYEYGFTNGIYSIDISNDGNYLIHSGFGDGITIINITSPTYFDTFLPVSKDLIWDAKISPNNRHVIYGDIAGIVGQWKLAEIEKVFSSMQHTQHIRAMAYHPSGNFFLSGGLDGLAYLFDDQTKQVIKSINHGERILDIDFSPTGDTILTAGWDGALRLWGDGKNIEHFDELSINIEDNILAYVPDVSGYASNIRKVQLLIDVNHNNHDTLDISFKLKFPMKIIDPFDKSYSIDGMYGIYEETTSLILQNAVVFEFEGMLLESDLPGDSVYIEEFEITNRNYVVEKDNGYISVEEWCPGEQARLISVDGSNDLLNIIKSPVDDLLTSEINYIVDGDYHLDIVNSSGDIIINLYNGYKKHGIEIEKFDINKLSNGVYFLMLRFEDRIYSEKFIKIEN